MVLVEGDEAVAGKGGEGRFVIADRLLDLFCRTVEVGGYLLPVDMVVAHQCLDDPTGDLFLRIEKVTFGDRQAAFFYLAEISIEIFRVLAVGVRQLANACNTEGINLSGRPAGTVTLEVTMERLFFDGMVQFVFR